MIKNRLDYYILVVVIGCIIIWFQFTVFNISKLNIESLDSQVDSLKIETKILKEDIKKDTIIININLKNGN